MKKFINDFKAFISKGNVVDMAVGIIIGASFQAVVKSVANDIIYPLISLLIGVDFTSLSVVLKPEVLNEANEVVKTAIVLSYGNLIQNIVDFLIIALSIFVGLRAITGIRNIYNYGKIKMLKTTKEKYPEAFEKDELGVKSEYNELKVKYPDKFKEEIALEKAMKEKDKVVEPSTNDLLKEILLELRNNNNNKENQVK